METSGIVYRTVSRLPAIRVDIGRRELNHPAVGVSVRHRNYCGRLSCQFSDVGHVQYYASSKKKHMEKSPQVKGVKKKLKFIKRLSKDLSLLPHMADGEEIGIGLIPQVKDSSEVFLAQLQQLKAEQKELKRKLKKERAQLKATLETSESSSSGDSECGEVGDMKTLRNNALEPLQEIQAPENMEAPMVTEEASLANSLIELENSDPSPQIRIQLPCSGVGSECCTSSGFIDDQRQSSSLVKVASAKKIEICMGVKCKKMGAAALLQEFDRKFGAEGSVVACKCMGKCKTAPNVRVFNSSSGTEDSVRLGISPTCTGAGLQDVDIDDECLTLSS
ncbi:hypothetical protein PTKIN_Ptkin15bG0067800 [Pterospermum kingtungense]